MPPPIHQPSHLETTRRDFLRTGLAASALLLAGCQDIRSTSSVPATPAPAPPAPTPGPGVLPRSAWTTHGPERPDDIAPMNGILYLSIHHEGATAYTSTSQADAAARIESLRRKHVETNHMGDFRYHYVIDPAGRVWEGRNIQYQGALIQDHNPHTAGVMLLGNYETQVPTLTQTNALDVFLTRLMMRYHVPTSRVRMALEVAPTASPGRNLQSYITKSRRDGPLTQLLRNAGEDSLIDR